MKRPASLAGRRVALMLVTTLPLLGVVGYGLRASVQEAEASARKQLPVQAAQAAAQVEAALDRAVRLLGFVAGRLSGQAVDEALCARALGGLTAVDGLIGNLGASDLEGRGLCVLTPGPGGRPATFAGDSGFAQARASEGLWVSRPFVSPLSGKPAMMMTEPLRDVAGRRVGLVGARIDLHQLDALLASLQRQPGGALTVVDAAGAAIRHAGDRPVARADGVDETLLQATSAAGRFGWRVVASVPREVVLAPVRQRALTATVAVLGAMLLGMLAAWVMARRLTRPLQDLLTTTRAHAAGRLEARADPNAPVEFGLLATEFNRMLDEQGQARAQLHESERRYADLLGSVRLAAAMVDLGGRITYANDHLLAITGWTREELLGQDFVNTLMAPRFRHLGKDFVDNFRAGTVPSHTTAEIIGRNGELLRMRSFNSPLRTADGRIAGLAMLGEDVTGQRLAEQRSARLSAFYAALSRTGEALIRMPDAPSLYAEICRICVEYGGADRADLIEAEGDGAALVAQSARVQLFDQKLYPTRFSLSERPWLLTSRAILHGEPMVCTDYATDPQTAQARQHGYGSGYKSLAALPLRRGGRVCGALVLFAAEAGIFDAAIVELLLRMTAGVSFALDRFDLETARKQALQAAESGLEQFQRLFQSSPALSVITSDAAGTVVDINDTACRAYGVQRQAVLGRTLASFGVGIDVQSRRLLYDEFARSGRVRNLEATVTTAEGPSRIALVSGEVIDWGGRRCFLTMGVDITDLRAAERASEQALAAERASEAKTEFISRMSHELRTPLNAVIGFAQLLEDLTEPLTARQRHHLRLLRDGGLHLQALIDDLIDVSSIEAGRLKVSPRPVALDAVVESALALCSAAAHQAQVRLGSRLAAGDAAIHVKADPTRLRQVLVNLVSNGAKYNRPGGRVEVTARVAGDAVCVDVADDGIGLTVEQQQRLFTPYDRLGRDGTGVAGTGIGLVVSRQLVELMGGRLTVHSEAGLGTRMTVALPRAEAHEHTDTEQVVPPPSGAGLVLYIEDEPVNQILVQEALRSCEGVELLLADNGRDGLALALEHRPDLVLVDMQLPDMDGSQVIAALRADPRTAGQLAVALSASAMSADVDGALNGGALEYWSKPIDIVRLRMDVRRLLSAVASRSSRAAGAS